MEHLESVEEARYMVEQANKDMDLADIGNLMDAALEQDQADCQQEGLSEHPEYIHLDTDGIEQTNNTKHDGNIFKRIDIPALTEYKRRNKEIRQVQERSGEHISKIC